MAEITSAKAMARTVRVSPRKSRLVLDNIRGKSVADAIAILTFTPNKAAEIILKVLNSAVAPKVQPIRGGTDGAQLSFKGLPCPNIFAGGVNFHGPYEFVSVQVMEKAMQVIINICRLTAEFND